MGHPDRLRLARVQRQLGHRRRGVVHLVDASGARGVWQSSGSFAGAIGVKLTYSLPPYGWLIDTTAELTNTSGSTVQDVYLMRGLDPDNCRMESQSVCDRNGDGTADGAASFMTQNTIVAQGSATATALVTATQTNDPYLGLRPIGDEGRATPAAGKVRVGARLTLPRPGRYTFIYVDPSGKRIGMATGSKVGPRTLKSRHSAPVLVTATEGPTSGSPPSWCAARPRASPCA